MRAVLLDADTLGQWQKPSNLQSESQTRKPQNVDLQPIADLFDELTIYPLTTPEQILERCSDAEVIITNKVVFNAETLQQLPNLKAIQLTATGMNNIDLEAAKAQGVQVFNVAGYSTFAVAQLTFSFILNAANRTTEHHQLVQQGAWQASRIFTLTDFPTMELQGKTLVLLGYGDIGQKVEQLAQTFDMQVLIANIPGRPMREKQIALSEALPQADFVSLHCPLTQETQNLVNTDFLKQMKSSAYLINTARGPIINEHDLAQALINGEIAGACLDVLSVEPPPADNPLLQPQVPNIVITPHIAWASQEAKARLIDGMVTKLSNWIKHL